MQIWKMLVSTAVELICKVVEFCFSIHVIPKTGALDISFNDLEGDLSVFSNYTNTISFSVNNNKFDGFVPGVIWDNEDMRGMFYALLLFA